MGDLVIKEGNQIKMIFREHTLVRYDCGPSEEEMLDREGTPNMCWQWDASEDTGKEGPSQVRKALKKANLSPPSP